MLQTKPLDAYAASNVSASPVQTFIRHWLTGRRGLIGGGVAVVAIGLALGWNWLTAIGVAPIILSLAPCAAMFALGTCAMMKGRGRTARPGVQTRRSCMPAIDNRCHHREMESELPTSSDKTFASLLICVVLSVLSKARLKRWHESALPEEE